MQQAHVAREVAGDRNMKGAWHEEVDGTKHMGEVIYLKFLLSAWFGYISTIDTYRAVGFYFHSLRNRTITDFCMLCIFKYHHVKLRSWFYAQDQVENLHLQWFLLSLSHTTIHCIPSTSGALTWNSRHLRTSGVFMSSGGLHIQIRCSEQRQCLIQQTFVRYLLLPRLLKHDYLFR